MKSINKVDDPIKFGFDLLGTGFIYVDTLSETEKPKTNSAIIAKFAEIDEDSVKSLARNYMGVSGFEVGKLPTKNGRPKEIYKFDEQQSIFIISLLKNTPNVVKFKYKLSVAFVKAKEILNNMRLNHELNKPVNNELKKSISDSDKFTNPRFDYNNVYKLIYKVSLGINTNKIKVQKVVKNHNSITKYLSDEERKKVSNIIRLATTYIELGYDYQMLKQVLKGVKFADKPKKLMLPMVI